MFKFKFKKQINIIHLTPPNVHVKIHVHTIVTSYEFVNMYYGEQNVCKSIESLRWSERDSARIVINMEIREQMDVV